MKSTSQRPLPLSLLFVGLLGLLLAAAACTPALDDDDDDASDDDDDDTTPGDDDDSSTGGADDDDTADDDDDDATSPVPCADPALEAALAAMIDWELKFTCSNAFMSFGPEAQTLRLAATVELEEGTVDAGDTYTVVFDGTFEPKDEARGGLSVQQGTNLMEWDCNDAVVIEPIVSRHWNASAGSMTLTVDSFQEAKAWEGHLNLYGVVVTDVDDPSASCSVPDFQWDGLNLGWLPG